MASSYASSSKSSVGLDPFSLGGKSNSNNVRVPPSDSRSKALDKYKEAKQDGSDIWCRRCKIIKAQLDDVVKVEEEEIAKLYNVIDVKDNRITHLIQQVEQLTDASRAKDNRIRNFEDLIRAKDETIIKLHDLLEAQRQSSGKYDFEEEKKVEDNDSNFCPGSALIFSESSTIGSSSNCGEKDDEIEWVVSPQHPNGGDTALRKHKRVYVGGVQPEVMKSRLKKCLEANFGGRVLEIDMLPAKNCAFVEFEKIDSYNNALNQGYVHLDGEMLHINRVKKHTLLRTMNSEEIRY